MLFYVQETALECDAKMHVRAQSGILNCYLSSSFAEVLIIG